MTSISIICVSYYSLHLLEKTIQDLVDNIENEIEIIIVNNSSDENLNSLRSHTIKIITPEKNLGYGGGVNFGLRYAQYENILIINPDIEVFKFDFPQQNGLFIAGGYRPDKPFGFKFPSVHEDTIGFLFTFLRAYTRHRIKCDPSEITKVDWITGSLIATNKTTLERLEGFDESFFLFYEEVDFCKRATKIDIPVFITPEIVYKASSAKEKASSVDVKWLKIRSEIDSFMQYHNKHSSKLTLHKFVIKSAACLFIFMLFFSIKNQKVKNMIRYYKVLRGI
jgi:N-acetylglucosaminyl-diphospho-decaprenol L-rhamnosyltransferase